MIMQSWRYQLARIQEWSNVERACIPAALVVLTFVHYLIWVALLLYLDKTQVLVDRAALVAAIPPLVVVMGGGVLVTLLGLWLRRRTPEADWFLYLAAFCYSASQIWGGYMVGPLSFVVGIVMTGAPLVGFILLPRRVTLVSTVFAFLVIMAINLATAYDLLPYAPILKSPQDGDSALLWTHSQFFLAAPHLLTIMTLAALILGQWRKREQAVLQQSLTDALTGVHNRRSILDLLDTELARNRRHTGACAVLLLDLDHFKRINDTWGHPTGDRVLREAAQALKACIRQSDEIGRFGGEEFLLLLPDTTPEGALQLAERCRAALAALTVTADNGERVPVSGSFGLACNAGATNAPTELLVRLADDALYAAKQAGRNRVVAAAAPDPALCTDVPTTAAPVWQGRLRRLSSAPGISRHERIDGRPWWQTRKGWGRLLAGTREWSPVAKIGLVMFLLLAMQWGGLGWLLYVLLRDDAAQLVNEAFGWRAAQAVAAFIVVGNLLMFFSIWLRKRQPDARWFQHLGLHFYSLVLIVEGYALGELYLPTGVILTCSPLIGFLLFRRKMMLTVWIVALGSAIAISYACALGWLPYAPLIALEGVAAYDLHTPFWVYSLYLFFVPVLLVVLALVDQVLGRWRQREAHIRSVSLTDALTQVHNRRSILERLEAEVQRNLRSGTPLAVALLDLDHFKRVNDTWGHPTGDRVLRETARVLRDTVRESDLLGRYGGEEFLLLLPDTTLETARPLLERCRRALAQIEIRADNGETFAVSASFGLTCSLPGRPVDASALTRRADEALYNAKAAGRNRVEVVAPEV
jgi:diguanylate cyclase (GGDEF)-like protein